MNSPRGYISVGRLFEAIVAVVERRLARLHSPSGGIFKPFDFFLAQLPLLGRWLCGRGFVARNGMLDNRLGGLRWRLVKPRLPPDMNALLDLVYVQYDRLVERKC